MSKNLGKTHLDYGGVIKDAHNHPDRALNTIDASSLVPVRFGKVDLEYITTGNGTGEIGKVTYFSDGIYRETTIVCRGDNSGTSHKTTLNFINKSPTSLAGKFLVIYDSVGAVKVWFNLDASSVEPAASGTYRSLEVNIVSLDDPDSMAFKTANILNSDSLFVALSSSFISLILSSTSGIRADSDTGTSSIILKNTPGTVAKPLNNTHWFLNSALNVTQYYIWYSVNGAGTDPLIPGKTGIMVIVPMGASSEQVAKYTKTALDSIPDFITNIDKSALLISNELVGSTQFFPDNTAGFTILDTKAGEERKLIVTLILTYNNANNLLSVERL